MIPIPEQSVDELYRSLWYEVNRMLSFKRSDQLRLFNYDTMADIRDRLTDKGEES